jgi:phage minor structural protein
MAYQIWIYTVAGVKTAILENAFGISRTLRMNETPTLSFSLPADDPKAVYLTSAYIVKVWNTKKLQLEGLFDINDAQDRWDSSGSVIDVTCSGAMARLEKTENVTYDTTATPKTPTQIITALIALQEFTPALTVGTIQPTTTFAMAVENTNLLTAVLKCPEYLGGYIDVSDTGALNWWNDPAGNPVREIRYKKNLKGLTRKRDYSQIRNKIYAYGEGESTAQITLITAGEAYEYIQDTTSETAYGVRIKRITDKRITHPATLLRWAQRYLAAYKDPFYTYAVDAVNLAAHPSFNFDLEELTIGQIVRVKNIDIALDVDVKIVALTTNLSSPEDIQIELANATPDLADLLGNAMAYQALSDNVAVQIGAGQVIVQGTFTVEDWTNGSTTKIVGDHLTTGTIDAATITLGTTGGNGIIQSGNYSADTAGFKIAGDGNAEFNSVKVRGTLYACTLETSNTMTVKGTIQSNNFSLVGLTGWQIKGDGGATFASVDLMGSLDVASSIEAGSGILGDRIDTNTTIKFWAYVSAGDAPNMSIFTSNGVNLRWKDSGGTSHDLY